MCGVGDREKGTVVETEDPSILNPEREETLINLISWVRAVQAGIVASTNRGCHHYWNVLFNKAIAVKRKTPLGVC